VNVPFPNDFLYILKGIFYLAITSLFLGAALGIATFNTEMYSSVSIKI
jgi:hypothetical protein